MAPSKKHIDKENIKYRVTQLLFELTLQLKAQDLWQQEAPSKEALMSTTPFCYDTLTFEQWLQFMFIPKVEIMLAINAPLPTAIALKPMAEEAFKGLGMQAKLLVKVIAEIDQTLSQP